MGRVFVIGNAGVDLRLLLPRLPRRGETLLGTQAARAPGGKGLNQAVTATRCGVEVRFCAPLGDDAQGAEIAGLIATEGIATLVLPRVPLPTDFSLLMVFPDGENSIVSAGPCAKALTPDVAERFLGEAQPGDVVLLQGNLSQETTAAALAAGRRLGARTILNTAPVSWDAKALLHDCTLVIANLEEAQTIAGSNEAAEAVDSLRGLGAETAIITLGAQGCLFSDGTGQQRRFPADRIDAVDTTGCGDVFCGVMAACLARGVAYVTAIGFAQTAAGLAATRAGAFAALPSSAELHHIRQTR
jgi:ribokinase